MTSKRLVDKEICRRNLSGSSSDDDSHELQIFELVILELGIRNSIVYHDMADCKLKITEGRRRRIQFLNSASQRNALVLSWTGIPFIVTFPELLPRLMTYR